MPAASGTTSPVARAGNRGYYGGVLTRRGCTLVACAWMAAHGTLLAQGVVVTGRVRLVPARGQVRDPDNSNAVVWLTPLDQTKSAAARNERAPGRYRLIQKNKQFTPHVLVVPAGAAVEFPNLDPVFHNVFSLFDGKRFDLGLYEAGTTRTVTFREPGVSYIFCNIHPEMSAVVIALTTPYHAISNAVGQFDITNVPNGRYQLNVWHERCLPESLKALSHTVEVSPASFSLDELRLPESSNLLSKHKNKYGRDYDPSPPAGAVYDQP